MIPKNKTQSIMTSATINFTIHKPVPREEWFTMRDAAKLINHKKIGRILACPSVTSVSAKGINFIKKRLKQKERHNGQN